MLIEFKLPELGENIESADITKVHVKVGDAVEVDQVLLEIETDKATIEVPSEVAGTVKELKINNGDTAAVGDVIIVFDSEGTAAPEVAKEVAEEKVEEVVEKTEEPKEEVVEAAPVQAGGVVEFKIPDLGENIESADITKVLVKAGDTIKADDVLLEIETDKATIEVPTDVSGVIKEVKIADGEKASVGQVVFVIESGDAPTAPAKQAEAPKAAAPVPEVKVEKTEPKPAAPTQVETPKTTSTRRQEMPAKVAPASPSVRRFAREIGVDIHNVPGGGPGGRIAVEDVKKYAKSINEKIEKGGAVGGSIGVAHEPLPDFTKWGDVRVEPMNNVRKKTAQHLSYAWQTVPHVTQFDKADITELEKVRKQYAKLAEASGGKLTVTAILLKVVASALKLFPNFNTSVDMQNNSVIYKDYYNVGIAVDTERGLIVPVVKNVDQKNIIELSAELSEISLKARNKKTTIDEMQGGNFTISNLGGIGGTAFTPIVNTPEVAILGVSRSSYEQVYIDGEFQPRLMMPLSLSYDHRIIDGADGARFLRWICQALEQPFLMNLQG